MLLQILLLMFLADGEVGADIVAHVGAESRADVVTNVEVVGDIVQNLRAEISAHGDDGVSGCIHFVVNDAAEVRAEDGGDVVADVSGDVEVVFNVSADVVADAAADVEIHARVLSDVVADAGD